jgi:hypothetical protein
MPPRAGPEFLPGEKHKTLLARIKTRHRLNAGTF